MGHALRTLPYRDRRFRMGLCWTSHHMWKYFSVSGSACAPLFCWSMCISGPQACFLLSVFQTPLWKERCWMTVTSWMLIWGISSCLSLNTSYFFLCLGFSHLLTDGVFHRLCPFPLLVSLCDSFFRETSRLLLFSCGSLHCHLKIPLDFLPSTFFSSVPLSLESQHL